MRPELKVGLIVGVVVLFGGVVYFVSLARKDATPPPADMGWLGKPGQPGPNTPAAGAGTPGASSTAFKSTTAGPNTPAPVLRTPNTPSLKPPISPPSINIPPPTLEPTPRPTTAPVVLPPRAEPNEPVRPGRAEEPLDLPPRFTPATQPATPAAPTTRSVLTDAPSVSLPPPTGRTSPPGNGTLPPPGGPRPASDPNRPADTTGARRHTIVEGDSLWKIAERYYDDGNLWPRIKAANPGLDERRLPAGRQIVIPPKEGAAPGAPGTPARPADTRPPAATPSPTPSPTPTPTTPPAPAVSPRPATEPNQPARRVRAATYKVEEGDTLIIIAMNILKDSSRWREIYELNRDKIPNPDILPVGIELKLPE